MPCEIIDGKALAQNVREEIKIKTKSLKEKGIIPGLAVVLVGEDPASQIYVRNKAIACQEAGMYSEVIKLPENTSEEELLAKVEELNTRKDIHGFLVQLPLPKHIDEEKVIIAINPKKDVDGFHPENVGNLFIGRDAMVSCTPAGCMKMIEEIGYDLTGKHAVVIGRSNIVGKPIFALLLRKHATVTICHSRTENLAEITKQADVLVAAVGKPGMVTGDMIKPGALVLDVGINRLPNGKVVGDIDFASASQVAGWLSPVPGGVGVMTITMLLENTLKAAQYE